jgi:hypothetical protein
MPVNHDSSVKLRSASKYTNFLQMGLFYPYKVFAMLGAPKDNTDTRTGKILLDACRWPQVAFQLLFSRKAH